MRAESPALELVVESEITGRWWDAPCSAESDCSKIPYIFVVDDQSQDSTRLPGSQYLSRTACQIQSHLPKTKKIFWL